MRVSKCSAISALPSLPNFLTYGQIKQKEGVYKLERERGSTRFITLKQNSIYVTLYYTNGELIPSISNWSGTNFVEVENATVCFEIREPS